jgi:hypothetical protein
MMCYTLVKLHDEIEVHEKKIIILLVFVLIDTAVVVLIVVTAIIIRSISNVILKSK